MVKDEKAGQREENCTPSRKANIATDCIFGMEAEVRDKAVTKDDN